MKASCIPKVMSGGIGKKHLVCKNIELDGENVNVTFRSCDENGVINKYDQPGYEQYTICVNGDDARNYRVGQIYTINLTISDVVAV